MRFISTLVSNLLCPQAELSCSKLQRKREELETNQCCVLWMFPGLPRLSQVIFELKYERQSLILIHYFTFEIAEIYSLSAGSKHSMIIFMIELLFHFLIIYDCEM